MGDLLDSMLDPNFEAPSVPTNDPLASAIRDSVLGQAQPVQNIQPQPTLVQPTPIAIAQPLPATVVSGRPNPMLSVQPKQAGTLSPALLLSQNPQMRQNLMNLLKTRK